jgi:PPM family protein phosphatase
MPETPPTKLAAHLQTDVGLVREHNEDAAYADPAGVYFIVADGMGGHAAGEVASAMAIEEIRRSLDEAKAEIESFAREPKDEGRQALVRVLDEAVRRAHRAVFERGTRETDKKGMGTTVDVVLVANGEAFVAHVGDSRTYLVRGREAAPVTTDHTVAEVLVIEGKLTPDEARLSPLRTILVNAIGVAPDVGVELSHLLLRKGDKLLLCSDGLHDYFPIDNELAELLDEQAGADGLSRLVELSKERGGHDNITGVLVEVVEGIPLEAAPPPRAAGERTTEEMTAQPDPGTAPEAAPAPVPAALEPTAPVAISGADGEAAADGEPRKPADVTQPLTPDVAESKGE